MSVNHIGSPTVARPNSVANNLNMQCPVSFPQLTMSPTRFWWGSYGTMLVAWIMTHDSSFAFDAEGWFKLMSCVSSRPRRQLHLLSNESFKCFLCLQGFSAVYRTYIQNVNLNVSLTNCNVCFKRLLLPNSFYGLLRSSSTHVVCLVYMLYPRPFPLEC